MHNNPVDFTTETLHVQQAIVDVESLNKIFNLEIASKRVCEKLSKLNELITFLSKQESINNKDIFKIINHKFNLYGYDDEDIDDSDYTTLSLAYLSQWNDDSLNYLLEKYLKILKVNNEK